MPLRDHFRTPLSQLRPWESFHTTWASALADHLNQSLLPAGYIALEQIHAGAPAEIDVATWSEPSSGGTATVAKTVWTPAAAPLVLPSNYPPGCTIEIQTEDGGRTLVAAIELVSLGNKDREIKRRQFAAKCATYLARGVGLVVIDVVTVRSANLHNDLMRMLGLDPSFERTDAPLYTVGYRPLQGDGEDRVEAWPMALALGEALPTVPLSLASDLCLGVDLEVAYADACKRRRVDEALA